MRQVCATVIAILLLGLGIGGISGHAGDNDQIILANFDILPPDTFIDFITPDPYIGQLPTQAVLRVTGNDTFSGGSNVTELSYRVDGGPWIPVDDVTIVGPGIITTREETIDLHNWTFGSHLIEANSSDGNWDLTPASYLYDVSDSTPPLVTFNQPPTPPDGSTVPVGTYVISVDVEDFQNVAVVGSCLLTAWNTSGSGYLVGPDQPMNFVLWFLGSNICMFEFLITENSEENVTYWVNVSDGFQTSNNIKTFTTQVPGYPDMIILEPGWNLISIWFIQENTSIEHVLSPISGKNDCVQYYDAFDSSDHWKIYCPLWPESLNDLHDINHTMGFWVHTTDFAGLDMDVNIPWNTEIPLKAGWNLVGYPSVNITNVEVVFASLPELERIECFDPSAPYRLREMVAPLDCLWFGEGYWFKVNADCIWTVTW